MIESLMTQAVTILRADTDVDVYGNTVTDWTETTSTATLAWIAQRTADDLLGDRDGEVSEWVGFFLPTVTITAQDRVVRGSMTFEVAGPINPAYTPLALHHLEVPLRVVAG